MVKLVVVDSYTACNAHCRWADLLHMNHSSTQSREEDTEWTSGHECNLPSTASFLSEVGIKRDVMFQKVLGRL